MEGGVGLGIEMVEEACEKGILPGEMIDAAGFVGEDDQKRVGLADGLLEGGGEGVEALEVSEGFGRGADGLARGGEEGVSVDVFADVKNAKENSFRRQAVEKS